MNTNQSTSNPAQPLLTHSFQRRANILNAIQQGVLTPSTKERLEALEESKNKLEISILQEQIKKPLLTKEQIRYWIYKFRELDYTSQAGKERLIDSFVNAVYVYSDKIILTFNFKDTTITLNLADLAGSDLDAASPPRNSYKGHDCLL